MTKSIVYTSSSSRHKASLYLAGSSSDAIFNLLTGLSGDQNNCCHTRTKVDSSTPQHTDPAGVQHSCEVTCCLWCSPP